MWNRHPPWTRRVFELHMAALLGDLEPSISFEPADDFSAAHV
jgi:hypothetical protein